MYKYIIVRMINTERCPLTFMLINSTHIQYTIVIFILKTLIFFTIDCHNDWHTF